MSLTLNPFDLLGDEGDGGRRRRVPQPKPAAPAPTPAVTAKPAAAPTTKPPPQQQPADKQKPSNAKAATPNAAPAKKENGTPKPRPQQGGDAQKGKSGGERRAPQQAGGNAPPAPRNTGDEGFGGQPKQNWHGERRERAPGRGRKFDRRSGTGRPPTEEKKSGSGKANWGKLGENEEEAAKEAAEAEKEETEKPAEGETAPVPEVEAAPKEPELKGLDEYYETLKSKAAKVEAPKKREAGEGVDQSAWKEYVPLSKEDGGEVAPLKLKKKDAAPKEVAKKETPASAEVLNFHLAPPQGVEERGGRRGGRGGGRSGDRGDRKGRGGGGDRGGRGGRQGGRGRGGHHDNGQAVTFGAEDFPVLGGSGGVSAPATAKPAATPAAAPAPVKA